MDEENRPSCIITGQQIGIFGGPLYTIYKILTAWVLARKYQSRPIFWMELNDSDFEEINHTWVLDNHFLLQKLKWKKNSGGMRVGELTTDEALFHLVGQFFSYLEPSPVSEYWRDIFAELYRPGRKWAEVSEELLRMILKDLDVQLFNPMNKDFIEFAQPILQREFERTPEGEQCNGFVLRNGRREAVYKREGCFFLRNGESVNPVRETLLPNYRSRPLIQDAYFPGGWQVAGPSEMQYLSELEELYQYHGIQQSRLIPRHSLTIIPESAKEFFVRNHMDPEELLNHSKKEWVMRFIRQREGMDVDSLQMQLIEEKNLFISRLKNYPVETRDIDYQLKKLIKMEVGKKRAEWKSKYKKEIDFLEQVYSLVKPLDLPQERIFSFVFMSAYLKQENLLEWFTQAIQDNKKILEI